MMDPAVKAFGAEIASITACSPTIPFLSTVTNEWIDADHVPETDYWARHMRAPVLFSGSIEQLLKKKKYAFIETGPRNTLSTLSRQHADAPGNPIVSLLSDTSSNFEECRAVQHALGSLWCNGVAIDWSRYYKDEVRYKVPLPLYPFEKTRYWVDPPLRATTAAPAPAATLQATTNMPAAQQQTPGTPAPSSESTDAIIATLTAAISEVFGRDIASYGPNTTFIEMGMDSLFLTQVAYKIRETYHVKVTFGYLMKEYPNLKKLSEYIAKSRPATPQPQKESPVALPPEAAPNTAAGPEQSIASGTSEQIILEQTKTISRLVRLLEKSGLQPDVPLPEVKIAIQPVHPTPSQQGILFSSRLTDALSASYNESVTITFKGGNITPGVLAEGVNFLAERYEALRAIFSSDGTTMRILPFSPREVPVEKALGNTNLTNAIHQEVAAAFDLVNGPLFKARIIISSKNEYHVILTAHHTIIDGWSLDILIMDLCEYCAQRLSGRPMGEDPVHSFVAFVSMINSRTQGDEYRKTKQFWLEQANRHFPLRELPTDFSRKAIKQFDANSTTLAISPSRFEALKRLTRENNCSLYTIMVAGLTILLHRILGNADFVLALAMAEQSFLSKNRLVGNCVDLLPFTTNIVGDSSFTNYLAAVQSAIIAIMDNHEYTLVELMRDRETPADSTQPAHVTTGLTHVKKFEKSELPANGYRISYQVNPKAFENFEIYFIALESVASLEIKCSYNTTLFTESTIVRWLGYLSAIFDAMVANPHQSIDHLFTLPASEAQRLRQNREKHTEVQSSQVASAPASGPTTQTEETLLALWQQLLKNKKLDMNSNFFASGGHSLMAAELFARIEKEFGCTLPLSTLYTSPTVRDLSHGIDSGTPPPERGDLWCPFKLPGQSIPCFSFMEQKEMFCSTKTLPNTWGAISRYTACSRLDLMAVPTSTPTSTLPQRRTSKRSRQCNPKDHITLAATALVERLPLKWRNSSPQQEIVSR